MFVRTFILALLISSAAASAPRRVSQELLVKLASTEGAGFLKSRFADVEHLTETWMKVNVSKAEAKHVAALKNHSAVEYVQPNYAVRLLEDYRMEDPLRRAIVGRLASREEKSMPPDNPAIPAEPSMGTGADPLFARQWGMNDIGARDAWSSGGTGSRDMIVAVIDTGVDYTHEDLLPNLWRNPGESGVDAAGRDRGTNGVDDDGNGYVDDVVGWDFVSNDNKPFDLALEPLEVLFKGGNPGHGTHCAGNVAARGENGLGVAGVAPGVRIMSLRFISEKGSGTTADAVKSIKYAVDNGARVLSNSWGSEGEDPSAGDENRALRDIIQYASDRGALFVAAAGNGHKGVGYDNDSDPKPAYPASYGHENIISVAALNAKDELGSFSNWGARSVDIGAPGVVVFSTTVGGKYDDVVVDKYGIRVTWDGTSMATPHVAGAAALYWSARPNADWRAVKAAVLGSAKRIPALSGKSVSGGKLDLRALVRGR